jgi:hypothetical protein
LTVIGSGGTIDNRFDESYRIGSANPGGRTERSSGWEQTAI